MGRECLFKGPGKESIPTEPDGSKRRDCSGPDQTSIRNLMDTQGGGERDIMGGGCVATILLMSAFLQGLNYFLSFRHLGIISQVGVHCLG
jgi:hypothetical protein